jgi:hypothetical protein
VFIGVQLQQLELGLGGAPPEAGQIDALHQAVETGLRLEVVGLVNQADDDVGHDFRRPGLEERPVLLAGSSRLDHLVGGAAALVDVSIAEPDGGVAHDLRLPVGAPILPAAVRGDEPVSRRAPMAS